MSISLRQIQAFLSVAELGSFTRAAERLGLSQPALSLLIRQLEADLELRLFDRTSRRTEITAAAHEFEEAMRKLVADLDTAVVNVKDLASRKRGRLTIAAPPNLSAVMMPHAIREFQRSFGGVQIKLIDTTVQIGDLIRAGKVDIGVGTFAPQEEGIDRALLGRDALLLFCLAESRFGLEREVPWKSLAGAPLIALTRESGVRHLVDSSYYAAGLQPRPAFEVSSMTTALAFVEADLGVSILPTYAVALTRGEAVVARPLVQPAVLRDICAITQQGRSLPPAGHHFLATLRKWARRSMPKLKPSKP